MKDMPGSAVDLAEIIERICGGELRAAGCVAVAVSGGPDSMALLWLLKQWAAQEGAPEIRALHVNHGLRAEAREEAKALQEAVEGLVVLNWEGDKPQVRIQEEARAARYELMAGYCREHDITHLFLAHHEDDQAETFLFRLAKGSGLDGLGGMAPVSDYDENLKLVRPLLEVSKDTLLDICEANNVDYLKDPSNKNDKFVRVRLRQARVVLEEEGLSAKRLSVTAKRLLRARFALDNMAGDAYKTLTLSKNSKRIVLKNDAWVELPEEIALRTLQKAMADLAGDEGYGARLERVENLFEDLKKQETFRRRTLGGVIFERDDKKGEIILELESR